MPEYINCLIGTINTIAYVGSDDFDVDDLFYDFAFDDFGFDVFHFDFPGYCFSLDSHLW